MILYFTGTGNSRFVAQGLARELGEECVCLNQYLKEQRPMVFRSEKPFVVVAPIYAWRFPAVIERIISTAEFQGSRLLYCVGTMASQTGAADRYLASIAEGAGMEFLGFRGVAMPNNYLSGGAMPSADQVEKTLKAALPVISEIAGIIRSGGRLSKTDKTPMSGLLSGAVNRGFNEYMLSRQRFTVEPECTGCGLCEKLCPMNNISIVAGKPSFASGCLSCYACIQHCPHQALNIGPKTRTRGRYTCPEYPKTRK